MLRIFPHWFPILSALISVAIPLPLPLPLPLPQTQLHVPCKSPVDEPTLKFLQYYTDLMSIAKCIDKPCGLAIGSQSWDCVDCDMYPGMQLVKVWTSGTQVYDMTAFVAVDHALCQVYLVIRGTETRHNILADLNVRMVGLGAGLGTGPGTGPGPGTGDECGVGSPAGTEPCGAGHEGESPLRHIADLCPSAKLHVGFYKSYLDSRSTALGILDETLAQNPDYQLVVVGHSLGGAIGTLFACEYLMRGMDSSQLMVVTAGLPVLGNKPFADWFNQQFVCSGTIAQGRNFFRMTRQGDIVPRVPFWTGYTPLDGEVYLQDGCNCTDMDAYYCSGAKNKQCVWGNPFPTSPTGLEHAYYRHSNYFGQLGSSCLA